MSVGRETTIKARDKTCHAITPGQFGSDGVDIDLAGNIYVLTEYDPHDASPNRDGVHVGTRYGEWQAYVICGLLSIRNSVCSKILM